jgi:hypothetical protein
MARRMRLREFLEVPLAVMAGRESGRQEREALDLQQQERDRNFALAVSQMAMGADQFRQQHGLNIQQQDLAAELGRGNLALGRDRFGFDQEEANRRNLLQLFPYLNPEGQELYGQLILGGAPAGPGVPSPGQPQPAAPPVAGVAAAGAPIPATPTGMSPVSATIPQAAGEGFAAPPVQPTQPGQQRMFRDPRAEQREDEQRKLRESVSLDLIEKTRTFVFSGENEDPALAQQFGELTRRYGHGEIDLHEYGSLASMLVPQGALPPRLQRQRARLSESASWLQDALEREAITGRAIGPARALLGRLMEATSEGSSESVMEEVERELRQFIERPRNFQRDFDRSARDFSLRLDGQRSWEIRDTEATRDIRMAIQRGNPDAILEFVVRQNRIVDRARAAGFDLEYFGGEDADPRPREGESPEEARARALRRVALWADDPESKRKIGQAALDNFNRTFNSSRWSQMSDAAREEMIEEIIKIGEEFDLPVPVTRLASQVELSPDMRARVQMHNDRLKADTEHRERMARIAEESNRVRLVVSGGGRVQIPAGTITLQAKLAAQVGMSESLYTQARANTPDYDPTTGEKPGWSGARRDTYNAWLDLQQDRAAMEAVDALVAEYKSYGGTQQQGGGQAQTFTVDEVRDGLRRRLGREPTQADIDAMLRQLQGGGR